ncbi:MAG: Ku protein [Bauldia sp.]|nr:Ku protein [Bauldia sp.]
MPARAYWSGQIRLALVSIPVQLFSATKTAARVSFNQIHRDSGKRIRYDKVVPGVGSVEPDQIIKGYEIEKGKYVLFEDDEIENLKMEAKRTIDLVQFVDEDEIDPVYFDKPLYVAPDDDDVAGEAYVVIRDALKKTGKVGLGQMVVRGKASVVALKPYGKGLIIETLRYEDEIAKADQFYDSVPNVKPDEELTGMAEDLIKRKAKPFDPKAFKDPYDAKLRELIQAKIDERPLEEVDEPEVGAQVINLMDALKRSMESAGAANRKPKKAAAKSAEPAEEKSEQAAPKRAGKAKAPAKAAAEEKKPAAKSRKAA